MSDRAENACFVISPIGDESSPERKRSDQLYKYVVTPAAEAHGYAPVRADKISEPGVITTQIVEYLRDAPVVVADLTDHNPNVYYELAVRHALQKPFVHMIEKRQKLPFDVSPNRAIKYDLDLDGADAAQNQLAEAIQRIKEGSPASDSPLTNALDSLTLARSDNPDRQVTSELFGLVQDIHLRFVNLESDLEVIIGQRIGTEVGMLDFIMDALGLLDAVTSSSEEVEEAVLRRTRDLVSSLERILSYLGLLMGQRDIQRMHHPSRWRVLTEVQHRLGLEQYIPFMDRVPF